MPILRSSKKALRVSERRTLVNKRNVDAYRKARKAVGKAIVAGKLTEVKVLQIKAQSKIDAAVKKGVLKKNTASRYKSRLAALVKKSGAK